MGGSLQLGPWLLWRVAVMTALTKGWIPVLWIGFSQKRDLPVHTDGEIQSLWCTEREQKLQKVAGLYLWLERGCLWAPDQYSWSVWHRHGFVWGTGTPKVALVRLPCWRITAAGESSSAFILRESLVGRPWGSEEPSVFWELWVSKLILCLHGCSKHYLKSYSKAIRTLCGLCSLS